MSAGFLFTMLIIGAAWVYDQWRNEQHVEDPNHFSNNPNSVWYENSPDDEDYY